MKSTQVEEMAETQVEEYFYNASSQFSDGCILRKCWAVDKDTYSRAISTTVLDFEHYSLHDATHSVSILHSIGNLLGTTNLAKLSVGDLWLLLECAYFHDIGMTVTQDEVRKFWTEDDKFKIFLKENVNNNVSDIRKATQYISTISALILDDMENLFSGEESSEVIEFDAGWPIEIKQYVKLIIAEYVRMEHGMRAVAKMADYNTANTDIEPRIYDLVATISYLHTTEFDEIFSCLEKEELFLGCIHVHPQFVAALLRMGDLLDMDNNRFSPDVMRHFGRLPYTSQLHFEKHRSLKHFNITPHQITATAESDRVEVCYEIEKWFQMIREENKKFIMHWGGIAPKELEGCTLSVCKLTVKYKGEEYKLSFSRNYEIDKNYAQRLFVGDNIYDTELEFIREYIQNALDAIKIEFGKSWYDGKFDYFLQRDYEERNSCMPYYFKVEAFEQYAIRVIVHIINSTELEICILDKGVGIEQEGIESLTTIGKGWKNRKKYQIQISESDIIWLKPTAGFGIGIQAAFMVSDEVVYYTKSRLESKGYIIELATPKKGGSVTIQKAEGILDGTRVRIKIPILKFLSSDFYRQRYPEAVRTYFREPDYKRDNTFSDETIVANIINGVSDYLQKQILNPLFPIYVETPQKNRYVEVDKSRIYSHFWYCRVDEGEGSGSYQFRKYVEWEENNSILYSIETDFSKIYVYDGERNVMSYLEFTEGDKGLFEYCFKGVQVIEECEEQYFYRGVLDILDGEVRQVLKVNRREFVSKINKQILHNQQIGIAMQIYLKKLLECLQTVNIMDLFSTMKSNQFRNIVLCIIKYMVKSGEEVSRDIRELLDKAEKYIAKDEAVFMKRVGRYGSPFIVKEGDMEVISFITLLFEFIRKEEIFFVDFTAANAMEKCININMDLELLKSEYQKNAYCADLCNIWKILDQGEVYIVDQANKDKIEMIRNILGEPAYVIGIENRVLGVYGCTRKEDAVTKSVIDFSSIVTAGERTICKNVMGYDKLHVKEIPFANMARETLKEGEDYLIMPMDASLLVKIELEVKNKTRFEDFFENFQGKDSQLTLEWSRLVDWVYKKQCSEKRYKKEEISAEYKRLLRDYYIYRKK